MTSTSTRVPDGLSYSVRACIRCSGRVEQTRSRFGRTILRCTACGKRAK